MARRKRPQGIPVVARARRGIAAPGEYDGPDAIRCPRCARGLKPNMRPGRIPEHTLDGRPGGPPCRGGSRLSGNDGLPVVTEAQARARRLVTTAMIARRFQTSTETVARWPSRDAFPEPVAILDGPATPGRGVERLYPADDVERWAKGAGRSSPAVRRTVMRGDL